MKLDEGRIVHPLELAARECMRVARESSNVWVALVAQNCALAIRRRNDWSVYLDSELK